MAVTHSTNLTDSDSHVSFDKIISLQDKFTLIPIKTGERNNM